jgi:hypothetical protein
MQVDNYIDPHNTDKIIDEIKSFQTLGDIKPLLDETFPTWIITTMPKYSLDYPYLQQNWEKICEQCKISPSQIMIVDSINMDSQHTLLLTFCEVLTRAGFCVRRKEEFFPCKVCNSALPNVQLYDILKQKGFKVPDNWSQLCSECT